MQVRIRDEARCATHRSGRARDVRVGSVGVRKEGEDSRLRRDGKSRSEIGVHERVRRELVWLFYLFHGGSAGAQNRLKSKTEALKLICPLSVRQCHSAQSSSWPPPVHTHAE